MSAPNKWGYKSKIKWVIIEEAPLSASGLNEILYAAEHRSSLLKIANLFNLKLTGRNSYHKIVKLDDCYPESSTEKPMQVGSPEHDKFCADECLKMALKDEADRIADEQDRIANGD